MAESFVLDLAAHLERVTLPDGLSTELEVEKWIAITVRAFTHKALRVPARDLDKVVYTHGETPEEKARWTASKRLQNVVAYGCSNTSDIFIAHPTVGSVYIEIKLARTRSETNNSLPGDLQRSLGQCVIAALRHPFVICLIVCQGKRRPRSHDLGENLCRALWDKHRIALVVRGIQ